MIRISAPSRLHLGLFSLPAKLPAQDVQSARHFGGVGLMIDRPGVVVTAAPAARWSASGPLAERALAFARKFLESVPAAAERAFAIAVEACAPEHVGLGTGTQLGLATALALAQCLELQCDAADLALRIGRGLRSGLGVHGFEHGGILVEGGKSAATAVAPLLLRHAFPEEWRVLVILLEGEAGTHGLAEQKAFARLADEEADPRRTDALCRLVLLGMLPALVERNLAAFGDAVFEFNRKVGEMFRPWQGGVYGHPGTEAVIKFLRERSVRGTGQSSWGPAVFAIVEAEAAGNIAEVARRKFGLATNNVVLTAACNHGARDRSSLTTNRAQ